MNDPRTMEHMSELNPVSLAAGLVQRLRPQLRKSPESATTCIDDLITTLERNAEARAAIRRAILEIVSERRQVGFYCDPGILPSTGFFTESFRRISETILPGTNDRKTLRDVISEIFDHPTDAVWLSDVPEQTWIELVDAMHFEEEENEALMRKVIVHSLAQMRESLRVLSYRISAIGLEDELLRVDPSLEKFASPFLAQNVEAITYLDAYEKWEDDASRPQHDERHLMVLLLQCRSVAAGIRRRAAESGTSFHLTFLLVRLEQNMSRAESLIDLLATIHRIFGKEPLGPVMRPKLVRLILELTRAECRRNDLRDYLKQTVALMSLRITENAGHTGEHYITTTRPEYFNMLRAGLGAGFIVAFMALLKIYLGALHLAPIPQIIVYGLDYGLGFVLIHMMHFTVATKQPAMTANALAAALCDTRSKKQNTELLAALVRRTARSQFAAIMGNLLLAVPTAIVIVMLLKLAVGGPLFSHEKSDGLLTAINPWTSGTLFYAAIAGVFLFLAGIVAGYFDNFCAYSRIPDRMIRTKWLTRVFGYNRVLGAARYIEDNLGALVGNFSFGFMLAGGWGLGALMGLPIDIRHITFSSANVGFAVADQGFATELALWLPAVLGVALIGMINLSVSFGLAVWVAVRSRGVKVDGMLLVKDVFNDFRKNTRSYFFPPKETIGPANPRTQDTKKH